MSIDCTFATTADHGKAEKARRGRVFPRGGTRLLAIAGLAGAAVSFAGVATATPAYADSEVSTSISGTWIVRSAPSTGAARSGSLAHGARVTITCQAIGSVVSVAGVGTSAIWDYSRQAGGYWSDLGSTATAYATRDHRLPLCPGTHQPTPPAPPAPTDLRHSSNVPYGQTLVAGARWLGGFGVDVRSNRGKTNSGMWQCVELVNRLYAARGWTSGNWRGHGYQKFDNAPANLAKEAQGHITWIGPGDVIVFNRAFNASYGHVAVVDTVHGSAVHTLSQNTSVSATTYTWSNGRILVGSSAAKVTGVIHAPRHVAPYQELLSSPSFEGSVAGWSRGNHGPSVNMSIYNNAARARTGSWFLETNTSVAGGSVQQSVPVAAQPGQAYTLSVWLRAPAGTINGTVAVWALGGTNENGSVGFTVGTNWTRVTVPMRVTKSGHNAMRAEIYLNTTGGNVDIDGASLVRTGA